MQPNAMNVIRELREYLEPIFDSIKKDLGRMYDAQQEISSYVRGIEVQVNQTMTAARQDIQLLKEREQSIRADLDEIRKDFDELRDETQKRHEDQIPINNGIRTLTKLLWAIFGIVLSLVLYFVRDLLLYGGVRGLP